MKRFYEVCALVTLMSLVGCASQTDKATGGPDRSRRITASGHTKEGCFLNLKLEAREKNVRLVPDDVDIDSNFLLLLFPFLNQEGYRCSGSYTERPKRSLEKDPLYPID